MNERTILWRRVDAPGHEWARLFQRDGSWHLHGMALFVDGERPCRLEYHVACDDAWRTRSATVAGWVGGDAVTVEVRALEGGRWALDGRVQPEVDGCTDVDLSFTPSTNLLPIRRLGLQVGERAEVRAAWLRFPGFTLEPLEQEYLRVEERLWRYSSAGGAFTADLLVDGDGLVMRYRGLWEVEASA